MIIQAYLSTIFLLWAGMILGISGLEAWIKFKTPGLSRSLALEVGHTVFRAFHRSQWLLWLLTLVPLLTGLTSHVFLTLEVVLLVVLAIQNLILFPALSANVRAVQHHEPVYYPWAHGCYAVVEIIKLIVLIVAGLYYH